MEIICRHHKALGAEPSMWWGSVLVNLRAFVPEIRISLPGPEEKGRIGPTAGPEYPGGMALT